MWKDYPIDYRRREVATLMRWIAAGQSGSVIGLPGCGRSNLLDFLCYRLDVIQQYLPDLVDNLVLVPVNLSDLPAYDVATFYRVLLRTFYQVSSTFDPELQQETAQRHQAVLDERDPFISQTALYQLLSMFQRARVQVVLVLNYLHHFVHMAPPETVRMLRGLRDRFRGSLCLIAGLAQDIAELPYSDRLTETYELLDRNTCWVGAMEEGDARNLIDRAIAAAESAPSEAEVEMMLQLSGNFPALLKLTATWWLNVHPKPAPHTWGDILRHAGNMELRLHKMWQALPHQERAVAQEMLKQGMTADEHLEAEHILTLTRLAEKGICRRTEAGWEIRSALLASYISDIAETPSQKRTDIWIHDLTKAIYQGTTAITDLAPLEEALLRYFAEHPYTPHDKESLIAHLWPDKGYEMNNNDLQQLVYRLRKRIDTQPPRYIVTWRGRPGGYRFYPEGNGDQA